MDSTPFSTVKLLSLLSVFCAELVQEVKEKIEIRMAKKKKNRFIKKVEIDLLSCFIELFFIENHVFCFCSEITVSSHEID